MQRVDGILARKLSKREKDHWLNNVIGEFDFVINYEKVNPDFVLLPEILFKKATVQARLRRDEDAVKSFKRSFEAKQNYWPAYAGLAEFLQSRGDAASAKAVVEDGLKYSPESKALNALLAELNKAGGKKQAEK